jgi:hypothetical protein
MSAAYTSIADATAALQAHPACHQLDVRPTAYLVMYPPGYIFPQGTIQHRDGDDLTDLNALYDKVDAFWSAQRLKIAKLA